MVRAVGLYPAGSRFESWLPYQPCDLSPTIPAPSRDASGRAEITTGRAGRAGRAGSRGVALDDPLDLLDQLGLPVGGQCSRGGQ
jgi:hypothetical protein